MALGFTFPVTSALQAFFQKSTFLFRLGKIWDERLTNEFSLQLKFGESLNCIHLAVVMVANKKIIS